LIFISAVHRILRLGEIDRRLLAEAKLPASYNGDHAKKMGGNFLVV
jgi:hypothetical protein